MTGGNSSHNIRFAPPSSSEPAASESVGSPDSPLVARKVTISAEGFPPTPAGAEGSAIANSASTLPPNFDSERTVISKESPAAVALPLAHLPPAEMGRLLAGTRLGHYQLQEFVGGGGMGAVFRALDTMLDRTVAVKVLSKVQSSDEETLRRFKNEAQSAARLDHENIGRVHYVGEDQGWHYIVFEFIEGVNLRDLVDRDGPLSLADAVSYTLQVADALAHASERDVVHRDIKPSNVLIAPGGRVKLVDMGLARLHQVEHSGDDLTASGVTLGTFDYISPEQARDPRNADVRSDIYSLGCTVYFMLTRRPPFPEGTVLQKLLQHQAEEPADPRLLRPDLPDELFKILRRMLAKAPAQRYQRPEGLIRDLLALSSKYGLPAPSTTAALWLGESSSRAARWARHIPWAAPMALLLLVAVVLAVANRSSDADGKPTPIRHASASAVDGARGTEPAALAGPAPPSNQVTSATAAGSTKDRSGPVTTPSPDSADGSERAQVELPKQPVAGSNPASSAASAREALNAPDWRRPSRFVRLTPLAPLESTSADRPERFNLHGWIQRRLNLSSWTATADDPPARTRGPMDEDVVQPSVRDSETALKESAAPSPERKGLLVVSRTRHGASEYTSLAEACRAAKSGDIIELRYNGRLASRPVNLAGQRLTVRAGDGFSPVISFQPRPSDLAQSSSMITLGGGQLTALNLRFELEVPREVVSETWTLGEIRPGESVRFDSCALTINNASESGTAYHPDVAFFEVRAVPGPGVMTASDPPAPLSAASLQLKNSVARGEAIFMRAAEPLPLQITWENGLLATSQRLFAVFGGPSDPKPQGQMQITLQHVTAFVPGGLIQLSSTPDAPQQLPLEVNASDCIFRGKSEPLIDQAGADEPEELRRRIVWTGDRNFYDGFDYWWRIGGPGGAETALQMTFADWRAFWASHEIQPSADHLTWRKQPSADRGVHLQVPADYALGAGESPAHNSASDGHDAGMQLDLLPALDEGN
jgi:serine/threonine protein kinase